MKQYTTPTVTITITNAAELLAAADKVVVNARTHRYTTGDYTATVSGNTVSAVLTADDTGLLGAGPVEFEVTIKTADGTILKTETATATIGESVRKGGAL